MKIRTLALMALPFLFQGHVASAATVPVASYSMNNGNGIEVLGTYDYLDWKYPSSPANITPHAPLSGGTGVLTDGIAPTTGYDGAPQAFVGWKYTDPLITFNLQPGQLPQAIVLYVNGVFTGLSGPPGAIEVNGTLASFTTSIHTCPGCSEAPGNWYNSKLTIALDESLFGSDPTQFAIQLFRGAYVDTENYQALHPDDSDYILNALNGQNKYFGGPGEGLQPWFHVSEVEFLAGVPEPSTWMMMVLGFLGVGVLAYRRRRGALASPQMA